MVVKEVFQNIKGESITDFLFGSVCIDDENGLCGTNTPSASYNNSRSYNSSRTFNLSDGSNYTNFYNRQAATTQSVRFSPVVVRKQKYHQISSQ